MQTEKTPLENVAERATDYLKTNLEIGEFKAMEYGSNAFAAIIGKVILLMAGFCFLIFISLSLAVYISSVTGIAWSGYLSVAGLYLLIFIVLFLGRNKWLNDSLANAFVSQFKNNPKHPEDLKDLGRIIKESQEKKDAQEIALKESVVIFGDTLKPENIILGMVGRLIGRFMDKKTESAAEKDGEESSGKSFASQFASDSVSKVIDMVKKRFFP